MALHFSRVALALEAQPMVLLVYCYKQLHRMLPAEVMVLLLQLEVQRAFPERKVEQKARK
jgi:hypothetical protein